MFVIIVTLLVVMANGLPIKEECSEAMEVVSRANNELSFKLFKMLSKDNNDVMSPLSILSALSILMNGAKGETLEDMKHFLEYNNSLQSCDQDNINKGFELLTNKYKTVQNSSTERTTESSKMYLANRVLVNDKSKIVPEFESIVKESFRADIQKADFENNAVEETNKLNEWIRNQTNNKIQKIFDELREDTSVVIANALYFKGLWKKSFDKKSVQKMDFYNNGVSPVPTDMMSQSGQYYRYGESSELDSQLLSLDYKSGDISFIIVLPKQRNGLNDLKNRINSNNFEQAIDSLRKRETNIFIPKFKAEKSYDLMADINPKPIALTQKADLTGITSDEIKVDKIQHKVFLEVDEKGTEAAAVTGLRAIFLSAKIERPVLFKADHPFLYFIRDKSNSMILFYGQINSF